MKKFLCSLTISVFAFSNFIFAQPGTLDLSFGIGGKASTDFGNYEAAYNVGKQSDGKIIAGGLTLNTAIDLARYDSAGNPDNSFGVNGKVYIPYNVYGSNRVGTGMTIQPDDKILIATGCSMDSIVLIRLNPDGSPDLSFGNAGFATAKVGLNVNYRHCVALQDSGKILVYSTVSNATYDLALVRFTNSGIVDSTFGTNGIAFTDITEDYSGDLAIQPDNKIVASASYIVSGQFQMMLLRFTPDGILDTTFSSDGWVAPNFFQQSYGNSVAIQTDGKIILGGIAGATIGMLRYLANGTLDNTFGSSGLVMASIPGPSTESEDMLIQPDGKIVLGGSNFSSVTSRNFLLLRYNDDGSIDSSFNSIGYVETDFTGSVDIGSALLLQDDGKIILAGDVIINFDHDFGVARYNGDATVSIAEFAASEKGILISPNPFSNQLNLKTSGAMEMKLYDLTGKIMAEEKFSGMEMSLNTEKLSAGYYLLQINDGKELKYFKVVKQ